MLSNRKHIILIFSFLAIVSLVFVFANTADAAGGLVPCGGSGQKACTKCDIFVLLQNIVDYIAKILAPVIATLLIVIGGFMMLLGGANPPMFSKGKEIFWNVMIGLVIFYGAWMITNTVLRSLAGEKNPFAAWNKIVCDETPISGPTGSTPTPTPTPAGVSECSKCGEGFSNICDEVECTALGVSGDGKGCTFTFSVLGSTCTPNDPTSGGGGASRCFEDPGTESSCGPEPGCRGTRVCQENGTFSQCDFSSSNDNFCTDAGGDAGVCQDGSCVPEGAAPGALTEDQARQQLASAGISVNAQPPQTMLEGMKQSTIDEVIRFKNSCGCSVTVTGGTEPGHSSAHTEGYKVDLGLNSTLNNFIIQNYPFIGVRNDGANLYRAPSGAVYALESNHWDVDVR